VANSASGNFEPAMSFSSLISGADCATSSNPLSQVLKHTDVDNSLQRVCQLPLFVCCWFLSRAIGSTRRTSRAICKFFLFETKKASKLYP
jgi:hypothetical protein